jgi:hypothetical protein
MNMRDTTHGSPFQDPYVDYFVDPKGVHIYIYIEVL